MARRFNRNFRRGRRMRPLLRWTAVNPTPDPFNLTAEGSDVDDQQILVDPSVYQQNESLEPDGATMVRCILDYYHVAAFIPDLVTPEHQPIGIGVFFDHAIIVADINFNSFGTLAVANWSDTMIKERVLWHASHDYTLGWIPRTGTSGTAGAAQAVSLASSNDLQPNPHFRVDFKVRAKLKQQTTVWWVSRVAAAGFNADEQVSGNVRMQARILIAGRF